MDGPKPLKEIAQDTPYPIDAYQFVRRGLEYTVQHIHEHPELLDEEERHVDGAQLTLGLIDFAVAQYGKLARMVLQRWNITRSEDFGQIVFAMVNGGIMQATEQDSIEDFDQVIEFSQAFRNDIPVDRVPVEGFEAVPEQTIV